MCKKNIRNEYKLRNTIFAENETITLTGQVLCRNEARYGKPESILLKNIKIVGSKYAGAKLDHLWIHVADIANFSDQAIRIGDEITLARCITHTMFASTSFTVMAISANVAEHIQSKRKVSSSTFITWNPVRSEGMHPIISLRCAKIAINSTILGN